MRLFVALEIPGEIRSRIAALIGRLAPSTGEMKWVNPANLHLTLKFIGEQPEARLESITSALAGVPFPRPMEIRFSGLGSFPRVFWIGVQAPEALGELARKIEESLVPLGVAPESRPYSPHLTLARLKKSRPIVELAEDRNQDFGSFQAEVFFLYQSQLSSKGPQHTKLGRFPST